MERRSFLKRLFGGAAAAVAVAVVAPSVITDCGDPWCGSIAGEGIIPHDELHGYHYDTIKADILEYSNYTNFSEFKLAKALDAEVMKTAEELGRRAGEDMLALWKHTFDTEAAQQLNLFA